MNITFEPLTESHFYLMLKWLEAPHVKKWWDQDLVYTPDLVKQKYESYVKGYKKINGVNKPIQAYIISVNHTAIGYIQLYNAYDFRGSKSLTGLPEKPGAFDAFIGEEKYLGKNIGSKAIMKFLSLYGNGYSHIFANPDLENIAAIKAYEKAGFKKIPKQKDTQEVWMLKQMKENTKPQVGLGVLIFNEKGQILLGKRKNSHGALSWGPPGGHLEFAESFERCAIRETLEETGLHISSPKFLAITNDLFEPDNKHYISVFMTANVAGERKARNLEPHKVEEWKWLALEELPNDLFLPLKQLLSGKAYGNSENLNNQAQIPEAGSNNKQEKVDTVIVYLTGKPGVGKYTIAKALSKNYGFIICDNQLINNPIFELLQYDGYAKIPDFAWDSITRLRTEIFEFLTKVPQNSYVLTNNLYEKDEDRKLYEQVKRMAHLRGSLFIPVRLLIPEEEHLKRVVRPERRKRWKSIDPREVYDQTPLLAIAHPNLLELDISKLKAKKAAERIFAHVQNLI